MDLKDFAGQNKNTKTAGKLDMAKLGSVVKDYEGRSEGELLDELAKAKKDGLITKEAVDSFFAAVDGVLPEEQKEKMKKILDSLE